MAKIRELVTRLDDRGEAAWPMKCVPCLVVDAEVLRDELWMLLPILGLPVTDKASTGGEIKITAMPRLQVLVVSAALPEVVAEVERWIRLLDQENAAEQQSIFFYNVRHSTADHLTEALGTFFNTTGTTSTGAAPTTKSTSSKAARAGTETGIPSMTNTASPSAPRSPGSKSSGTKREPTEAKTVFDVPVTVFTDTDQNRLTVLTSPRVYVMVEALLKRLDIPPRQVLIQATLAEITLNKDMEYGFSYAALTRFKGKDIAWALPNGNPVLNSAGAIIANPNTTNGGSLVFHSTVPTTGPPDNIGFIKAVAGEENTHVLATPQILATNDKEAIINVGDRVPIITGDTTDVSATGGTTGTSQNLYRSVQYVDTGNILTVTPHITAGNEVRLEIKQESSNAFKGESSGIDSPTIRTRTLQTECVVPDGGSVMMAGMIRTEKADSHSGVPFLKDIPWVGWLFRSNVKKDWRTEILVIVSVRVVEPTSDVDKLAQRYQVALKDIREQARK